MGQGFDFAAFVCEAFGKPIWRETLLRAGLQDTENEHEFTWTSQCLYTGDCLCG